MAIIGMSGRFAQADDLDAFWDLLSEGRDGIGVVPADRWDWRELMGDPLREPGRTDVKWGGFAQGIADFDPGFFGIAPKDAVHMDPQQRLLMLYTWKALEDAGYAADALAGSDLGLFVGTGNTGYGLISERGGGGDAVTPTSGVPSAGPNRMSYFLDVHGPSEPVETACSSSLVAMDRAVAALERGECAMAVAGGVNTIVVPDGHVSFSRSGMLSKDGRCKTFSASADGYGRGEGVGMLVLKPLSMAERDGDHVHGLIRSTAKNHGGRASSLTAPNPQAQTAVLHKAYSAAGIDPRTVGYVEAHGTGTRLGDPIEITGLKEAFRRLAEDHGAPASAGDVALGSVKTNIGHLELAAGVAGVIKVLLQMKHRTLAPSLHADELNPYIDFSGSPFRLVRERQEWTAPRDADGRELPRRAGVSSFGFGGVNAHVVLEEYVAPADPPPPADGPVAVVLSATDEHLLRARARQLVEWIGAGHEAELADVAYTLQVGRVAMPQRLAFLAESLPEVRRKLDAYLAGDRTVGVHTGHAERDPVWAELVGDDDVSAALDSWIAKGKLGRLLKLWVSGFDFAWERLHTERRRRVPLPVYGFDLKRYWIGDADRGSATKTAPRPSHDTDAPSRTLHATDALLDDHRVAGAPTLPGAAHLEYARAALGAESGVVLRDVTWLRTLEVADAVELTVEVRDGAFRARVGDVVYAEGRARTDTIPGHVRDLDAERGECTAHLDEAEVYARFDRMGMSYGPAFRAIEELHHGPGVALGRLRLPEAAPDGSVLNPALVDGALQTTLGLALAETGGVSDEAALPFVVREVRVLGATPTAGWAVARPSADDRPGSGVRRYDIDVCDDDGTVRLRLLGFSARVKPRTAARETAMLAEPTWVDAPTDTSVTGDPTRVVLCELPTVDADALGSLLGDCTSWPGEGGIEARYTALAERLLDLLRENLGTSAVLQVVVPDDAPWLAGLSGMLRTASAENPRLTAQLIRIDDAPAPTVLAERLRHDAGHPEQDVRYRSGRRQVSRWSLIPDTETEMPWRDGGVYLITGGAGGLGALFATDIATRVQDPVLVLCGRSAAGPHHEELLTTLRAAGAKVDYRELDVTDRAATDRVVGEIEAAHGSLNGVVHTAGVLRDGLLAAKTAEDLRAVLAAKVAGVRHLDEATADSALDCFIAFSSTAAFGNAGQADYAAANGFVDGYARYRRDLARTGERHGRTLAVNWPLWEAGGMSGTEATVSLLASVGMRPMRASVGIDALDRAWATGLPQVIALDGEHARMRENLGLLAPRENGPQDGVEPPQDRITETEPDRGERGAVPSAAGRPNDADTAGVVTGLLAELLEIEPTELAPDVPLREYGFDSIFLMQFLTRAQTHIDAGLSLEVLVECDTLDEVIAAIVRAAEGPEEERETAPADPNDFPELIRMNGETEGRPVFWVHHGNGGVESYAPIAARAGRPFFGIQPKGWMDGTEILTGQVPMARFYAELITKVQPEGPYDIGGFSLGGLFAYEVVRQLQLRGAEVGTLVMLDTLDAASTNKANDLIVGGAFDDETVTKVSAFRAVNLILGNDDFEYSGASPILHRDDVDTDQDSKAFLDALIAQALERGVQKTEKQLRTRVRQLARYLEATQGERYETRPLPDADGPRCYYLRNAGLEFFGPFREHMVLFPNEDLPPVDGTDYGLGWAEWFTEFEVIDVPTTTHSEVMTEPAALDTLLELCDRIYASEEVR
ncbi:SDR family NAD(P)-dependent oxidoreductase [Nocardiopsis sp. MG754419]|uniref:SDR family NAD(P)-dependent oxidoreductase n=1 Tax=Nocardiopsis sp. MG754419 TaxID=2259865 RepID=UPI001BAB291D|nr:SDR family NAD(P)-dependent oxidoreductase [Nocardiopsis sp. MG754419]